MDFYMEQAFREALKAYSKKEVPVGCIIVKDDEIIAVGHNSIEGEKDVTCHAEIVALRQAQNHLANWRLNGTKMYVTLEPCLMCMGAILHARISELHIGTRDLQRGAAVSKIPVISEELLPSDLTVYLHEDEACKYLLQRFFRQLRKKPKK